MRFVALGAVMAALVAPAALASEHPLKGTVGPGFSITLTREGQKVKTLRPGTYRIAVSDKAATHNFHLIGPGVNKKTSVGGTGSRTWTVTLRKGKYTYQCDPHAAGGMKGTFTVR
jgi:plastocyanin